MADNKEPTGVEDVSAQLANFVLPEIADNPDGWGPHTDPDSAGLLFAPFNKTDRVGKISDWNNQTRRGRYPQTFGAGSGLFGFKPEDDETSFSLVDNRPKPKPRYGRRVFKRYPQRRRGGWRGGWRGRGRGGWRGGKNNKRNNRWGGYGRRNRWGYNPYDRLQDSRDASVTVQEDWAVSGEDIVFADISKLTFPRPQATDLVTCGILEKYDTKFNGVTPKNPTTLQRFENREHCTATTSDDPVLQRLAKEKAGNVYATDTILAVLMASPRSVNSWDLVIRKTEDGSIFLDKRPTSRIDFLSVNENWNEVLQTDKENINHPINLSTEATNILHNFSQQILTSEKTKKFDQPNPFADDVAEGNTPASGAFRYRRWDLGDDIKLVARTLTNGFTDRGLLTIKALNEFDLKMSGNWRQKLESQTGAVLATEMKNNSNKLARWTAETELAGSDELRLGFVSRAHSKDSYRHQILMSKRYPPKTFAISINVKISNLWGVLKHILERCQKLKAGTFLMQKDPNKAAVRFYEIPEDAFADEDEME